MSLNEPTYQKLIEMNLTVMADAFQQQQGDPKALQLEFDDRFSMMVDAEHNARYDRRLHRRLHEAQLRIPNACVEDVHASATRGLDKTLLRRLAGGDWITQHLGVLISGATGVGKSYLACALGHRACRLGHRVLYRRLPRMFEELALAKADGTYGRLLARLARYDVLILDDLGTGGLLDGQRHDLLELVEDRYERSSTILASQLPIAKWHEWVGDPTLADAILDRIVHSAYKVTLTGPSGRKDKHQQLQG
jgi:DNA replication protein DnaC